MEVSNVEQDLVFEFKRKKESKIHEMLWEICHARNGNTQNHELSVNGKTFTFTFFFFSYL